MSQSTYWGSSPTGTRDTDPETTTDDPGGVSSPSGDPTTVVRTDRRAVCVQTVVGGLVGLFNPRRFAAVVLPAVLVGLVAGPVWGGGVGVTVLTGSVAGSVIERDLARGHLVYEIYPECIVCRDRLLGASQWRLDRRTIAGVVDQTDTLDRLLTVSTVGLRRHDADRQSLRCLRDAVDPSVFEPGVRDDSRE